MIDVPNGDTHDVTVRECFGAPTTEADEQRFYRAMDDLARALGFEGFPSDPDPALYSGEDA